MTPSPANISKLAANEIFVFGSNEAGRHGAGAARYAQAFFGAEWRVGNGPTGRCYAIPTKDWNVRTLPLPAIARYVLTFLDYARQHPELVFLVTEVGCLRAGYSPSDIAPMFAQAPENVRLPERFITILNRDTDPHPPRQPSAGAGE